MRNHHATHAVTYAVLAMVGYAFAALNSWIASGMAEVVGEVLFTVLSLIFLVYGIACCVLALRSIYIACTIRR